MKLVYFLLFVLAVFAMGCAKTLSDNIKTDGFYASYKISGNNAGTAVCTASLQVGGVTGTYIDLVNGDVVTCDGQSMSRSEFAGIITYTASVPYVVGKTYNVVLTRAGEGSYTASVVLPEQIANFSPSGNPSFQKGSIINASWNTSSSGSDTMSIYLSYSAGGNSYSYSKFDSAPENGLLTFPGAETQVFPAAPGNWPATLRFYRSQTGQMDSALDGSITAEQVQQVNITLTD